MRATFRSIRTTQLFFALMRTKCWESFLDLSLKPFGLAVCPSKLSLVVLNMDQEDVSAEAYSLR